MNNLFAYSLWRWLFPLFIALGLIYLSLCYLSNSCLQPIAQAHADAAAAPDEVAEAAVLRSPLEIELRQYIEDYFAVLASSDTDKLMEFYAEQIDYYTWGLVDKMVVAQEKRDYFARWPEVQQELIGEIDISPTDKSNEKIVVYLLNFIVINPEQKQDFNRISGQARHTWRLRQTPEGWKIIEEKQRVLSRQKNYQEIQENKAATP